jgi:alkylation response protein AidB-like acyl-CoA dehydrogenase
MYFDGEFLEKKMSSNLLDLPRVETRDVDYVERARRLAPMLKEAADEIEERRELPERVVEALIEGGFFKLLIPRSLGGAELRPLTYVQVLEEIGKAEPSTAWSLGQNSGCSMSAPYLDPMVAREIFGPPRGILACVPVFEPDGTPRMNPNGRPHVRTVLFPKSKAEIIDNWQVIGLRGTGSDSYRVEDLFVPQKHTVSRDNPARSCWACPREECSASGRAAL